MTASHKPGPKDNRAYPARNEDVYQSRGKYPEPSMCTGCGAIFHKGRWQWGIAEPQAHKHLCPACQRIHDRMPAGIVTISGDFFTEHQQEVSGLVHNVEARQKATHPLQRIMSIHGRDHGIEIALTDVHLTHAIVEALLHAYKGESDQSYVEHDDVLRIDWRH